MDGALLQMRGVSSLPLTCMNAGILCTRTSVLSFFCNTQKAGNQWRVGILSTGSGIQMRGGCRLREEEEWKGEKGKFCWLAYKILILCRGNNLPWDRSSSSIVADTSFCKSANDELSFPLLKFLFQIRSLSLAYVVLRTADAATWIRTATCQGYGAPMQ